MSLEVGTVVDEQFRIEKVIGRGGMGVVAIATDVRLGRQVALKVLHDALATEPSVVDRFVREARMPMQLKSDHVCRVLDVGTLASGAPYIVMELLEGNDLASLVAREPLPIATAVDYVLQALVGVAEAHALGIVHRDLKPANLFVTRRLDGSPLVKVLDFGIAKPPAADDTRLTQTAAVIGTPGYMSPEQLRSSRDVDARTDIWALGAILYELVSGRVPFPATNVTELAMKVAVDAPDPLEVEPAYRAIVFRCLEKELARRYPNVGELARDLAPLGGPTASANASLIAKLVAAHAPHVVAINSAVDAASPTVGATAGPEPTPPRRVVGTVVVTVAILLIVGVAVGVGSVVRDRVTADTVPHDASNDPDLNGVTAGRQRQALNAYERDDFGEALGAAETILLGSPGNLDMRELATRAACRLGKIDVAHEHARQLPPERRADALAKCPIAP